MTGKTFLIQKRRPYRKRPSARSGNGTKQASPSLPAEPSTYFLFERRVTDFSESSWPGTVPAHPPEPMRGGTRALFSSPEPSTNIAVIGATPRTPLARRGLDTVPPAPLKIRRDRTPFIARNENAKRWLMAGSPTPLRVFLARHGPAVHAPVQAGPCPFIARVVLIASNENAVLNGALSHRVTFGPNVACTAPGPTPH
jgi:hypothetical protein